MLAYARFILCLRTLNLAYPAISHDRPTMARRRWPSRFWRCLRVYILHIYIYIFVRLFLWRSLKRSGLRSILVTFWFTEQFENY